MFGRLALPVSVCLSFLLTVFAMGQQAPPASGARILLLPKQIVSGERATLAVLDVAGRLTPGVTVTFSRQDTYETFRSAFDFRVERIIFLFIVKPTAVQSESIAPSR